MQNRLESTIRNQSNISENVTGKIGYNLDKEEGEYQLNINKSIKSIND